MSATPEREPRGTWVVVIREIAGNEDELLGPFRSEEKAEAVAQRLRGRRADVLRMQDARGATPEREQAEALQMIDALRLELPGEVWGDVKRIVLALVERERVLTRALERIASGKGNDGGSYQTGQIAREALAGGVSAAGRGQAELRRQFATEKPDRNPGGGTAAVAEVGGLIAQRDYYRRRWLIHGIHHRQRMTREEYVSVVMRHLSEARSRDALTAATALQRSHQQGVPPVVPEVPEYDDDDPASISREMCPPEVLPEETRP